VIQWLSIKTSWVFRGGLPGKKARKRTNSGTDGTNQRRIFSKKQKTKNETDCNNNSNKKHILLESYLKVQKGFDGRSW